MGQGYAFEPDLAGREMMRTIERGTAAVYWHADGGPVLDNGSMFFVRTEKALFGVTAKHVYEGYLECAEAVPTIFQINDLVVDPKGRLIGTSTEIDIATFDIKPNELALLGNITVPWPPQKPCEGAGVFVCGLPGSARGMPAPRTVTFKHFTALMRVDSVSERAISMVRQPNEEMVEIYGREPPPPNMDIGGMSGGPIAVHMKTPQGVTCWFLSAVISEGHQTYDIIHGARADWINEDGTIRA